jgi:hypothetical protein
MALGPGKYDDACTALRESLHARGAIIIVMDGVQGTGFSAQLPERDMILMPHILRTLADGIEQGSIEAATETAVEKPNES